MMNGFKIDNVYQKEVHNLVGVATYTTTVETHVHMRLLGGKDFTRHIYDKFLAAHIARTHVILDLFGCPELDDKVVDNWNFHIARDSILPETSYRIDALCSMRVKLPGLYLFIPTKVYSGYEYAD